MVPAERLSKALVQDSILRPTPAVSSKRKLRRFLVRWACLSAVALWAVGGFAQASVSNYRLDALKASYQAAVQKHQSLEVTAAEISDPQQLVGLASNLHMTTPSSVLVVSPRAPLQVAKKTVRKVGLASQVWRAALNFIVGSLEQSLGVW